MINNLLNFKIKVNIKDKHDQIKAPGLLESHYSPNARVYLSGKPAAGDGYIAPNNFPTPVGAIRLIAPVNNEEYARDLYYGLRLADSKKIVKVFVVLPIGDDIAVAICDRLKKALTNTALSK
jgi:L-threonylcarbamoyladenylate synthase